MSARASASIWRCSTGICHNAGHVRRPLCGRLLVGPGGVWAVQVKATGAPLRAQSDRWEVQRGRRWVAAQPDPARQVTSQATALNDFFKRQGFSRFVDRAIALADPQPFDQFTASEIPGCRGSTICCAGAPTSSAQSRKAPHVPQKPPIGASRLYGGFSVAACFTPDRRRSVVSGRRPTVGRVAPRDPPPPGGSARPPQPWQTSAGRA